MFKKVALVIFAVILVGCSDQIDKASLKVPIGKVVLLKARYLQDNKTHYGAIIIAEVEPPRKTSENTIISYASYRRMVEGEQINHKETKRTNDSSPIKIGAGEPGLTVHWDYANKESVYISQNVFGAELGTHFCATSYEQFPSKPLSSIQCEYQVPTEYEK
jgi:hypothetical protein